jgi:hypothetical protein
MINQLLQGAAGAVTKATGPAQRVVAGAAGQVNRVRRRNPVAKDLDDVTLARKVETQIFRAAPAAKGKVDVNAVDGVVQLRGQLRTAAQIKALEAAARAIPEVKDVDNLLRTKGTPSPTRADTPRRQQKAGRVPAGRRSSTAKAKEGVRAKRVQKVTDDHTTAIAGKAEPSPDELAKKREGRQAAPLGAKDSADKPASSGGGATEPASSGQGNGSAQPNGGGAAQPSGSTPSTPATAPAGGTRKTGADTSADS